MKRLHLFEWEDQSWFPRLLRDYITDHLRFGLESRRAAAFHRAVGERLKKAMEHVETREIVDLCSGGGGPLLAVQRCLASELAFPVNVTLTDLYPNAIAFRQREAEGDGCIRCRYDSVSAFDVPPDLEGMRTIFTAFHHFRPADARRILEDAVAKRVGVAVFEWAERTPLMVGTIGLFSIIHALIFTPWVGNLSVARLLLTYIIPVGPIIMAWDGTVSALRTYTVQELREMVAGLDGGYSWDIQRVVVPAGVGSMRFICLIGLPDRT